MTKNPHVAEPVGPDGWTGCRYWLLQRRWNYWVIFTPVKGNRPQAHKRHERLIPKAKRVKLSFYSRAAARKAAKAQAERTGRKPRLRALAGLRFRRYRAQQAMRERMGWPVYMAHRLRRAMRD